MRDEQRETSDEIRTTRHERRSKSERGAAAVEFALILPLLLLLVFGIIEFGLALHRQQVLSHASREGARAGIVQTVPRPDRGAIERVVRTVLTAAGLNPSEALVSVTGAGGASGSDLTVLVQSPYRFFLLPGLGAGIGASITLRAQTVMKLE